MSVLYETNKFQTSITEELMETYPKEVQDEFFEIINTVPFIKRLISPDRKYARDLERDEYGYIIVDVCNPHILENTDYFRPTAINFIKYHKLTNYKINGNPKSDYGKWIRTEVDRIFNGMVRESDGEWITGEMYFYLNYMPMELAEKIKKKDKGIDNRAKTRRAKKEASKAANRITSMPRFWEGSYLWFHYLEQARYGGKYDWEGGNHGVQIATRGASKSFSCASMLARLFVCGDNEDTTKNVTGIILAHLNDTLTKDGTLVKYEKCINHCALHTQFPRARLRNSIKDMTWELGYIDPTDKIKKGTRNTTIGVSVNNNEDKGRGTRATKIIWEEIGAFPKFLDSWSTNEPGVSEGSNVWGQLIGIGTGGSEGSNFYGIMEMLYNPKGYHVYPLPNVYDKKASKSGTSVFFFGAYLNREGFYNKDGVSDVVGAILFILKNRFDVKYNTTDPARLTRVIAERPLTIQEAIMQKGVSIFPVASLTERLNDINANNHEYDDVFVGKMSVVNGDVSFKPTVGNVIRNFPHSNNKLDGAIEIFKMPEKNAEGKVFSGRYVSGLDPVDDDASETLSLQSCFILDLWTDSIVAEYTGRPYYAETYYEQFRLLLLFYNARCNYENNKKGIFGYMQKMNSSYLLTDTLEFLKDRDMVKGEQIGNKSKGTNASAPINNHARSQIRDWLIAPITIVTVDKDGEEVEKTIARLYTLRSKALIQELIQWNKDGNFDRVSSLGMLMLLREDYMIKYGGNVKEKQSTVDDSYLGKDDFFSDNYGDEEDDYPITF